MSDSTNALLTDPRLLRALARLSEEAAEVIKVTSKTIRFGTRPRRNGVQYDNVVDLTRESIDLLRRTRETLEIFGVSWNQVVLASLRPKEAPDDEYGT